ncbi:MAG TPA: ABC transporter permease subunit [Beijerinckiaceae bacterium]|jgi:ABC-type nitrate/sulfonate/bicarbonate transport system permease component|nr:ABC transporter permease subunit [Beijerinckiaceae bacterium]
MTIEVMQEKPALPRLPKHERYAGIVTAVGIVILLQIASMVAPHYIAPPPADIISSLWNKLLPLYGDMLLTLGRLALALGCAMLIGTGLGLVMGMFPTARPYVRSVVVIDTGIPALSWMLIAVFWFRMPELRIFFILLVIVIPFYALGVADAIRAMPKDLLEMCESFRPNRWQVLRYLIFPHVLPYIFATTRSVIGYATRMIIFAELIAATAGIGAQMGLAQANFDIATILAWTILLVGLNIVLQQLVTWVEQYMLSYRQTIEVR